MEGDSSSKCSMLCILLLAEIDGAVNYWQWRQRRGHGWARRRVLGSGQINRRRRGVESSGATAMCSSGRSRHGLWRRTWVRCEQREAAMQAAGLTGASPQV
ncbi:hypothetical protein M0R45_001644 [Rubus argutus]|uniref:Uncharacterized protein n=1 Tax=Rubus argutus TaxID=59490 RepID=A0AAW1VMA3_RUBAR